MVETLYILHMVQCYALLGRSKRLMDLWVKAKINPFPKNIISISDNVNIVDVVLLVVFYVRIEKN